MKPTILSQRLPLLVALAVVAGVGMAHGQAPLNATRTVAMPEVEGRIDHLTVDISTGRVFVAALGNDSVEVIDGRAGKWLRRLTGFKEPQGIAFVPERHL